MSDRYFEGVHTIEVGGVSYVRADTIERLTREREEAIDTAYRNKERAEEAEARVKDLTRQGGDWRWEVEKHAARAERYRKAIEKADKCLTEGYIPMTSSDMRLYDEQHVNVAHSILRNALADEEGEGR